MTKFSRTVVCRAPAAMRIPLVFPVMVFWSTTFPLAVPMTPMPKSSAGCENPLPLVEFSRTRLLWPAIHMPPHDAPALVDPLRTDVIPSTSVPNDVAAMNTPAPQLVDAVRSWMWVSVDP